MKTSKSTQWLGKSRSEICQQLARDDITHFANMTHVTSLKMVFQFKKQRCTYVWYLAS